MRVDPQEAARESLKMALAGMAIETRWSAEDIRPLGDQVLVLPDKPSEFSGLIFIPEIARKHEMLLRTGTVVSVGAGDMLEGGKRGPMFCKTGDRVVYDQASNRVVKFDGVDYAILRHEQHILAVIE